MYAFEADRTGNRKGRKYGERRQSEDGQVDVWMYEKIASSCTKTTVESSFRVREGGQRGGTTRHNIIAVVYVTYCVCRYDEGEKDRGVITRKEWSSGDENEGQMVSLLVSL
jgi:hypothetical protein